MRNIRSCPVAVVGGAGFLGSHLVDHLLNDRHCEVLVLDNLSAGRREFVHPKAIFEYADITDSEDRLRKLFQKYRTRYVFNYAAHPYIPVSFERPLHVFDTNARGAIQVINAAQDAGCEGILQVSSAELYGSCGMVPHHAGIPPYPRHIERKIKETDPVEPHSSYGAAKAAVDSFVQVRWREAQTPCIALRQFNCVGARETHPYVIPEIIGQLNRQRENRKAIVQLGNDSARDFLAAEDQARMATELLEKGTFGEVYNLGSESSIGIYDLARLLGRLMGFDETLIEQDPTRIRPWEIWALCSNNGKVYSLLGSRPTLPLEHALQKTIDDYQANGCKWCWE